MTLLSRLLVWFPAAHLTAVAAGVTLGLSVRSPTVVLASLSGLYLVPLIAHRVHQAAWPRLEGARRLRGTSYDPWWGSQQIQWVFLAFPTLETLLRAVPGLFSLWLRAWGSSIGRDVYWTPALTIADRSLLHIGDGVVFGQGVSLSAHLVKPTDDGDLLVVVRRIRIGEQAFVGAGCVLGPGAIIRPGERINASTVRVGAG